MELFFFDLVTSQLWPTPTNGDLVKNHVGLRGRPWRKRGFRIRDAALFSVPVYFIRFDFADVRIFIE